MAAAKISEVRHNKKLGIVQIKMNKGPNHTLRFDAAERFVQLREDFLNAGGGQHFADMYAANTYIKETENV